MYPRRVTGRRYGQYCAAAKALDVVGERWSLLVVRELLDGPRRYTDLQAGLPGISTDMLAARLRDLETTGVIMRDTLPPPGAAKVYVLTPLGDGLRGPITELARWGLRLIGKPEADDAFRIHWLGLPLRVMFRPEAARGVELVVRFVVDGDELHVRIEKGRMSSVHGRDVSPDVVVTADSAATVAEIGREPASAAAAFATGRLQVAGAPDDIARLGAVLGFIDSTADAVVDSG